MKRKYVVTKMAAIAFAAAIAASVPVSAFAAGELKAVNNTATVNDLKNADIIDMSQDGSLTIRKYDITSATKDGVYTAGEYEATGEENSTLEDRMADYAIEGVEFTYLYCGKVETYSISGGTTSEIQVVYEIPNALRKILKLATADAVNMKADGVADKCSNAGVYHYTSQQIGDALKALLEADDVAAKNALENYVESDSNSVKMALTDKNGLTRADELELGLYLVVETKVPEEVTDTVNPWFVSLPFTDAEGEKWLYDMTCYPKNQTGNPSLDKLVRNAHGDAANTAGAYENYKHVVSNDVNGGQKAEDFVAERDEYVYDDTTTASEGDLLDYILVSKIPHISSESTYLTKYNFTDTLSEGITYGEDVRLAFYHSEEDAMVNNTANADEIWGFGEKDQYNQDYAVVYSDYKAETGETQLTVSFTEKGLELLNTTKSDYYIVVYYTATVNQDATTVLGDDGNPNDVSLEWRRTSDSYYNTLEDRCYVYTFGIDLTKEFSDGKGDPTKVQFALYNASDAYYVVAEKTQNVDGKKVYYVTGKTTEQTEATVFSPDENGALIVNGLEGDTYQLTETATDSGYSLLKDQIVVSIKETEREIRPAECGYVGNDSVENSHVHNEACKDAKGALICGYPSDDDANGRTIGKVAMYVGDIDPASATVDGVDASMADYIVTRDTLFDGIANYRAKEVINNIESADAKVNIGITNTKDFLLPQTGGNGLYVVTIAGVAAVAGGCYCVARRKRKHADA